MERAEPARNKRDWPKLKRQAVSMMRDGIPIPQISAKLRVSRQALEKWRALHGVLKNTPTKKPANPTPPPYVLGYRWFNVRL